MVHTFHFVSIHPLKCMWTTKTSGPQYRDFGFFIQIAPNRFEPNIMIWGPNIMILGPQYHDIGFFFPQRTATGLLAQKKYVRGFVIFLLRATIGREAQNGAFWGCVPESLALKPSVISAGHPKVMTLMTQYDTVVNEFAWRLFPYEMRWPRLTTIKSVMACSGTYVWMVWGAHCRISRITTRIHTRLHYDSTCLRFDIRTIYTKIASHKVRI